ncbi:tail fiber protein [Oscillospiraceae bacterium CM]|nr:tail fiber protein [Oscillospiraceae bacterium CM]
MAITPLTDDLNIIAVLDDEPNDEGGLTPLAFKEKFDEAGNAIKSYINDTLVPELATERSTDLADIAQNLTDAVAAAEIQSGNLPAGGGTGQLLTKNSGDNYDFGWQDPTGTSEATPGTIAKRDENGRLKVADPEDDGDVATKGYVDNADAVGTVKQALVNPWGSKGLLCNGASFDAATYPDLAALIKDCPSEDLTAGLTTAQCDDILKFGNYFVGLGSNRVYYTDDPTGAWTYVELTGFTSTKRIKIINGQLVVVGATASAQQIAYCTDITGAWTYLTVISSTAQVAYDIVYDGNYYYVVSHNGSTNLSTIYYSNTLNGNYTAGVTQSNSKTDISMEYANGYIAVAYSYSNAVKVWQMTTAAARVSGSGGSVISISSATSDLSEIIHDGTRWILIVLFQNVYDSMFLSVYFCETDEPSAFNQNIIDEDVPYSMTGAGLGSYSKFRYLDGRYYFLCQYYYSTGGFAVMYHTDDIKKLWGMIVFNAGHGLRTFYKDSSYFVFGRNGTSILYCPTKRLPMFNDDNVYTYIKALL